MYGFVLPVAQEGQAQLQWCLGHFRKAFPDAPLVVISDGVTGYKDTVERFNGKYVEGAYLKRIECGGAWWKRALGEGLLLDRPWIVKFDPDTKFHRPFNVEPKGDVCGHIDHVGTTRENVLGGCQAIRATVAERILTSKILDSPALMNHRTFEPDERTLRHWRARSFMGSDMSLAWVARNLGLEMAEWGDVGIDWRAPAPEGDFAATHPHKLQTQPFFADAPLRVITTCKGRLEHLKRTLPTWLEPNVHVTVVDYDCPQKTAEWVRANHPECDVVRVKNRPKFNLSDARNIGAQHTSEGWFCFFDADLLATSGWSDAIRKSLAPKQYLLAKPIEWNQFGSVVVHSWDFKEAGGYDSLIAGWGAEDGDFYNRLRHIGIRPGCFPGEFTSSIQHSDAERTVHYTIKNKKQSQNLYEKYVNDKQSIMFLTGKLPTLDQRLSLLPKATPLPAPEVEVVRGGPKAQQRHVVVEVRFHEEVFDRLEAIFKPKKRWWWRGHA